MTLSPTAQRAIAAYGGENRWRSASTLTLDLSAGGLAFTLKWQPALVRAHQEHTVWSPRSRCAHVDPAGNTGVLDGGDVRLESPDGAALDARFPPTLPTHSPVQRFRFATDTGLLVQQDYTAEIIGGWANAARVVLEHGTSDGIPYPRRIRMTPRAGDGTPRSVPVLVAVEADNFELR